MKKLTLMLRGKEIPYIENFEYMGDKIYLMEYKGYILFGTQRNLLYSMSICDRDGDTDPIQSIIDMINSLSLEVELKGKAIFETYNQSIINRLNEDISLYEYMLSTLSTKLDELLFEIEMKS
jgi:hypothetical protein